MTRGGARPGAGRKKGPPKRMVTFYLREDIVEQLPRERSALVERLLERWMRQNEKKRRDSGDNPSDDKLYQQSKKTH